MLHPNQFQVNEAWLVFQMNDAPICTEADGDFNIMVLMDAGSCFIFSSALVPIGAQPSELEAKRLFKEAQAHKQELPQTLFVPNHMQAALIIAEAQRRGITVVRVPENQLLPFIGEARECFREHRGGSDTH